MINSPPLHLSPSLSSILYGLILFNSLYALNSSATSCRTDLDCTQLNHPLDKTATNLGAYACVDSYCRFLVKAGELCDSAQDCVGYQYLVRSNNTLLTSSTNLCSSNFCSLESSCGSAWEGANLTPPFKQKCCGGISSTTLTCPSQGIQKVDVCAAGTSCIITDEGHRCEAMAHLNQTWIGVVLVLLGGSFLNFGLNLQKFALNRHEAKKKAADLLTENQDAHSGREALGMAATLDLITAENAPALSTSPNNLIPINSLKGGMSSTLDSNSVSRESGQLDLHRISRVLSRGTQVTVLGLHSKIRSFTTSWRASVLSPLWVLGLLIYIGASGLNFVALQFAPQSLVGPLGSVALITNIILAPLMNKEKLGRTDFFGILLIIGGCVMVVFFSGIVQPDYRLCVLFQLFSKPPTIALLTIIIGLLLIIFIYIKIVERNLSIPFSQPVSITTLAQNGSNHDFAHSLTSKHLNSTHKQSFWSKLFDPETSCFEPIIPLLSKPISQSSRHYRYALPLSYAGMGSLMATLTTLFAKTLVNLLSISIFQGNNQFNSWLSWLILIFVAFTAFSQVYWITLGLRRYDALLQVPVFYVIWTLFDIIGGGIYYDEFRGFTPLKYGMFCLGVAIIFSGVVVLARRMSSSRV